MLYEAELHYFRQQASLSLPKILHITAHHAGRYAAYYRTVIRPPFKKECERKRQTHVLREGHLPLDREEKERCITETLDWILNLDPWWTSFELYLAASPIPSSPDPLKMILTYSAWSVWTLNLSPHTFEELKRAFSAHDLPDDLFYPETAKIYVPWQPTSTVGKMIHKLGLTKTSCYSPKEWEERRCEMGK